MAINLGGWLLWGLLSTLAMTTLLSISRGRGLTRINLILLLGMAFTPSRDRAKRIGLFLHLVSGWFFALLYIAIFTSWQHAGWLSGAGIGLVHALFVLTEGMDILPSLHPRMASELQGPEETKQLEP